MKKSRMEKAAAEAAKAMQRTGHSGADNSPSATVANGTAAGLKLGRFELIPLEELKENPHNAIFRTMKTKEYWERLKRDIRETGSIIYPLIALPDGTLLEGESRLRVAKELHAEGVPGFDRVPVRKTGDISPDEQKKRLYLGNLSRFEIDTATRIKLYAEIWPDYFNQDTEAARKQGLKQGNATPSATVANGKEPDGIPARTARHHRKILHEAREQHGTQTPEIDQIRQTMEKRNQKRRQSQNTPPDKRRSPTNAAKPSGKGQDTPRNADAVTLLSDVRQALKAGTTPGDRREIIQQLGNVFREVMQQSADAERKKYAAELKKELKAWEEK